MLRRKMLAAALATGLAGALVLGGCQGSGSKGKTADGKDSMRFMVGDRQPSWNSIRRPWMPSMNRVRMLR